MANRNWAHNGDLKLLRNRCESGEKWAALDVLEYCRVEKKPVPAWAVDCVISQLQNIRWDEGHPQSNRDKGRTRRRLSDLEIRDLVTLHKRNNTWECAYELAGKSLRISPASAKGAYVRAQAQAKKARQEIAELEKQNNVVRLQLPIP